MKWEKNKKHEEIKFGTERVIYKFMWKPTEFSGHMFWLCWVRVKQFYSGCSWLTSHGAVNSKWVEEGPKVEEEDETRNTGGVHD